MPTGFDKAFESILYPAVKPWTKLPGSACTVDTVSSAYDPYDVIPTFRWLPSSDSYGCFWSADFDRLSSADPYIDGTNEDNFWQRSHTLRDISLLNNLLRGEKIAGKSVDIRG